MCIRDRYEGMENRSNIIIDKDCTRIGQGDEADAVIGKDTISPVSYTHLCACQ